MPTARQRHVITETEPVAQALDDAARRWPDDAGHRARLVLRLVEEGHRAVVADLQRGAAERREAIQVTSGALTGAYGPGYLHRLREDWPG